MNRIAPAMLAIALFASASANGQPAPAPAAQPSFVVGEGARVFDSASARGSYLVVHVLSGAASDANTKHLADISAGIPTLACVKHVFIQSAPAERFAATLAAAPAMAAPLLYRDSSGTLASAFGLTTTCTIQGNSVSAPAVMVFDPEGKEVFRRAGASDTDRTNFGALSRTLAGQTTDRASSESNLESGLALQGYDPVIYLDQQKAMPGEKGIVSAYRGVTYRFASTTTRDAFNTNPARYLPAYGGWCATAMADGRKVEVDPKNFKVTNGRVFLFYKGFLGNALNDWKKDESGLTTKADANWTKLTTPK